MHCFGTELEEQNEELEKELEGTRGHALFWRSRTRGHALFCELKELRDLHCFGDGFRGRNTDQWKSESAQELVAFADDLGRRMLLCTCPQVDTANTTIRRVCCRYYPMAASHLRWLSGDNRACLPSHAIVDGYLR